VQAHGGKIWVQSAAGGGAEFVLEVLNAKVAIEPPPVMAGAEAANG
jgi:hypothetical protein